MQIKFENPVRFLNPSLPQPSTAGMPDPPDLQAAHGSPANSDPAFSHRSAGRPPADRKRNRRCFRRASAHWIPDN